MDHQLKWIIQLHQFPLKCPVELEVLTMQRLVALDPVKSLLQLLRSAALPDALLAFVKSPLGLLCFEA